MKNPIIIGILLFWCWLGGIGFNTAAAQLVRFTYAGPKILYVGADCKSSLQWAQDTSLTASTYPDTLNSRLILVLKPYFVGIKASDSLTYKAGDKVPLGTSIFVKYIANYTDLRKVPAVNGSQTYTIVLPTKDTIAPVFNTLLPSTITASCDSLAHITTINAIDNCAGSVSISYVDISNATCAAGFRRVWTATDASGNKSTISRTLIPISDTKAPVLISNAQNRINNCSTTGLASDFKNWLTTHAGANVTDDCGGVTWTYSPVNASVASANCGQNVTVTFTATDRCGNSTNTTATYTLMDTTPPAIIRAAEDRIVECDFSNNFNILNNWLDSRAGSIVKDSCTDEARLSVTFKINGQIVDKAAVQVAMSASLGEGCKNNVKIGNATFNHIKGKVTVTFEFTDICGNKNTTEGTFAIIDNTPPVFQTQARNYVLECDDKIDDFLGYWHRTAGESFAVDLCSPVTYRANLTLLQAQAALAAAQRDSCGKRGTIQLQFFADDACGNTTLTPTTARFSVIDTKAPIIATQARDTSITCKDVVQQRLALSNFINYHGNALAIDNCDAAVIWAYKWTDKNGLTGQNVLPNIPTTQTCSWFVDITFTPTDSCGNTSTNATKARFSFEDKIKPIFINVPKDTLIDCKALIPAVANIIAQDNCTTQVSLTKTEVNTPLSDCQGAYKITRTWTATDECGNSDTAAQIIIVKDLVPPTLSNVPANITAECSAIPSPVAPIADDVNCSNITAITMKLTSTNNRDTSTNSCGYFNYTLTRTWMATDACGNTATASQQITLQDTEKPTFTAPADMTVECDKINDLSIAGKPTNVRDNCDASPTTMTLPDLILKGNCANDYTIKRTWTVSDKCGNSNTAIQTIKVTDSAPPSIVIAPKDSTLVCSSTTQADEAFFHWLTSFGRASVSDKCGGLKQIFAAKPNSYSLSDTTTYKNAVIPTLVEISQCKDNTLPRPYTDGIYRAATVDFVFVDLCGNATKSTATFKVMDNTSPKFQYCPPDISVANKANICEADINLPLPTVSDECNNSVLLEYQINDETKQPLGSTIVKKTLPVGIHTVKYIATDCVGNQSTCSYQITVRDTVPPTILCSTADVTINADTLNCIVALPLNLPTAYSDNCGFANSFSSTNQRFLTFTNNPNRSIFIADDQTFTFSNATANAIDNAILTVEIRGDIDNPAQGEFFTIVGENNVILGTTQGATGACDKNAKTTFFIPKNTLNDWASDGSIVIKAISNIDFSAPNTLTEAGINPCTPNKSIDSISTIRLQLAYNRIIPSFYTTGATIIPSTVLPTDGSIQKVNFNAGKTVVYYTISDASGNTGYCSYNVNVKDITSPVAKCNSATFFVNPTGIVSDTLKPALINGNSTDNCGIDSMFVTPSLFSCADISSGLKTVSLKVWDKTRNSSTCAASVKVEAMFPIPSYSLKLCGRQTLSLFANPPKVVGTANPYTFAWKGPNNFTSTLENPVIPNADDTFSGAYEVTITGLTGCTASAAVQVIINKQPNTPTIVPKDETPCSSDGIVLNTQSYTGTVVKYFWYSGTAPNGALISTTTTSALTIANPAQGNYNYYVIVEVDGCLSNPSAAVALSVSGSPTASTTNAPLLEKCAGDAVTLGTNISGIGYTYEWKGPNGFSSTAQFPPVINNISTANSGTYSLTIALNGCPSAPINTIVSVKNRPAKPELSANTPICEGQLLIFNTNNAFGGTYHWLPPNAPERITTANELRISAASLALSGDWRVFISDNGCDSEYSDLKNIVVNAAPIVSVFNSSPVCANSTVQLNATAIPGATYSWTGPDQYQAVVFNPTAPANAGVYTVYVTSSGGCTAFANTTVSVNPIPIITAISDNGSPCVAGTTDIKLVPTIFPADNGKFQYQWAGPNGFLSSNATAIIPNGTAAASGSYTLVVKDDKGCSTVSKTHVVSVANLPSTPQLRENSLRLCEGESLTLSLSTTYSGKIISYVWETPRQKITTLTPSLNIAKVSPEDAGTYTVFVIVDGCESNVSGAATVQITPTPPAPFANSNSPVCSGQRIQLSTTLLPNATYEWIGANNFTSSVNNPIIADATSLQEGIYKVRMIINGCISAYSNDVFVDVNNTPTAPVLITATPVLCISSPGAAFTMNITPNSAISGATYTWYDTQKNKVLGAPSNSLDFKMSDFANYANGSYQFHAIANFNGCISAASQPLSVIMNTIPNLKAQAGDDISLCRETSVALNAAAPTIGSGQWTQVSGLPITIANPTLANTLINGLANGQTYTFAWSLSNGACGSYSIDNVNIIVGGGGEKAVAGDTIRLCNVLTTNLAAKMPTGQGTLGKWSQNVAQAQLGVAIAEPNNPTSTVTGLNANSTYSFTWTLSNGNCDNFSSDIVIVKIGEAPKEAANAGKDFSICISDNVSLNANTPRNGIIGTWHSANSNIRFSSTISPDATISGLKVGQNVLVWSLRHNICGIFARDTVIVNYQQPPVANKDVHAVKFASNGTSINVVADDLKNTNFSVNVKTTPTNGALVPDPSQKGVYVYVPKSNFAGLDIFTYELCNDGCEVCSVAETTLNVGGDSACTTPTVITPNNDGINDQFIIPCLASGKYGNNSLIVFNQWGSEVFRASPYQNNWDGTFDGQQLPPSTYFFIFDAGDGNAKQSGFVVIER